VEVLEDIGFQQFGVQPRHPVDREAAGNRQIRHAHIAWPMFIDQRHPGEARVVARKANAHLVKEALVDLADDFEMSRQHAPEQIQPPFLERLGQQRMVGVGKGLAGD
jgi:hypothetical protein